jgi:hypothetical protein
VTAERVISSSSKIFSEKYNEFTAEELEADGLIDAEKI